MHGAMPNDPLTPLDEGEAARDRSLPDDLRALAAHGRAFASAEFAFQKARAGYVGRQAKNIAILVVVAVVFVFFALMGLVFGLILALTPPLTAWGATAVVCGVLLAVALGCLWLAFRQWRGMSAALSEGSTT